MKNKIAMIIPYFGQFNNYFPFFLISCGNNPEFDFLIYTDDKSFYDYPNNVKVVYISFDNFRKKVQDNFDFLISLEKPYKLCDFKPAYGEIFEADLKEYDFWGYCDCDLILGKLTDFISDNLLSEYDKLFSRGHFTIFRNSPNNNSFYRTQRFYNYKNILSSSKSYAFDEWGGKRFLAKF